MEPSDPVSGRPGLLLFNPSEHFDQPTDPPRRKRLPAIGQRLVICEPRSSFREFFGRCPYRCGSIDSCSRDL